MVARARSNPRIDRVSPHRITLWLSNRLHWEVQQHLAQGPWNYSGYPTLVEFLIRFYLEAPRRFDDLTEHSDSLRQVRTGPRVDADLYERFKGVLRPQGISVVDAITGLLRVHMDATHTHQLTPASEDKGA